MEALILENEYDIDESIQGHSQNLFVQLKKEKDERFYSPMLHRMEIF